MARPRIAVSELNGYHFVVVGTPDAAVCIQTRSNGTPCNLTFEAGHNFGLDAYKEYGPLVKSEEAEPSATTESLPVVSRFGEDDNPDGLAGDDADYTFADGKEPI